MKKNTLKLMQQPNKINKRDLVRGIFILLSPIAILAFIGIITEKYWLTNIAIAIVAVIILFAAYIALGYMFEQKRLFALNVKCNPFKYYLYLQLCRIPYYFLPFDKPYYKIELAIGLRNQGRFDKAKKVLLSINIKNFSRPEHLVLYYNNLCDIYILLNDNKTAQESADKGFAALELITDETVREYWQCQLNENQIYLNMQKGDTSGCEEFFFSNLEKAVCEYSRIESHLNLGRYYQTIKQNDNALPHFEYIVKNGNKLFHVDYAKKQITEINKAGVEKGNAEQYKKTEGALKKSEDFKAESEQKRAAAIEAAQKLQAEQLTARPNPKKINKPLNIIFICIGGAMALFIIFMIIYTSTTAP